MSDPRVETIKRLQEEIIKDRDKKKSEIKKILKKEGILSLVDSLQNVPIKQSLVPGFLDLRGEILFNMDE